eukprot:Nitzschia sp. Nitz4//scaffold204_size40132//18169//19097//NITZ4_007544-RA/size40132-snap-gene-0.3-mRNA-1//1//CDS//3329541479//2098//frame0
MAAPFKKARNEKEEHNSNVLPSSISPEIGDRDELFDLEYLCMDSRGDTTSLNRCFHEDMMNTISELNEDDEPCGPPQEQEVYIVGELPHQERCKDVKVVSGVQDPMLSECERGGGLSSTCYYEEGENHHRTSNCKMIVAESQGEAQALFDDNASGGGATEAAQQEENIVTPPPTSTTQVQLRDCDVLGGRGGAANHHVGNRLYWQLILERREEYKAVHPNNSTKKTEIALTVFSYIKDRGSRFLEPKESTNELVELSKDRALEKIKRALRAEFIPYAFRDIQSS